MHVVCVGDCGVDRYVERDGAPEILRAGGITLNFAAHACRLFEGRDDRVSVVSALGDDAHAEIVTAALTEMPVEARLVRRRGRTSVQHIDLEASGEKIFLDYQQGVLGEFRVGAAERAVIATADLLMAPHYRQIEGFFESVMTSPSPGLRAVDFADIAEHPAIDNVDRFVDRLDVAFFGLTPEHGTLIDALGDIAARHRKLFIVTLGPAGSLALSESGRVSCPAVRVAEVVDTTGAGDTFAAGFLSEYRVAGNVRASLSRGASEAAATVSRRGGF